MATECSNVHTIRRPQRHKYIEFERVGFVNKLFCAGKKKKASTDDAITANRKTIRSNYEAKSEQKKKKERKKEKGLLFYDPLYIHRLAQRTQQTEKQKPDERKEKNDRKMNKKKRHSLFELKMSRYSVRMAITPKFLLKSFLLVSIFNIDGAVIALDRTIYRCSFDC